MNPSGLRIEEKKSGDSYHGGFGAPPETTRSNDSSHNGGNIDKALSTHSSSRSSVLERAREYNRRIDEQNKQRRAKSLERGQHDHYNGPETSDAGSNYSNHHHQQTTTPRSRSVGRMSGGGGSGNGGSRMSTHERAMASVRNDSGRNTTPTTATASSSPSQHHQHHGGGTPRSASSSASSRRASSSSSQQQQQLHHQRMNGSNSGYHVSRPPPTSPHDVVNDGDEGEETEPDHRRHHSHHNRLSSGSSPTQQQQQMTSTSPPNGAHHHQYGNGYNNSSHRHRSSGGGLSSSPSDDNKASSPSRSLRSGSHRHSQQQQQQDENEPQQEAVVSPELLVDALSGHEDGLLAIAEKLMEHYDGGYDVMGEAIIDAFADVQKLFQHVVEAAHMEGAAFEASRREEEMQELRKRAAVGEFMDADDDAGGQGAGAANGSPGGGGGPAGSPNGPSRHDEFIDQDVKDVLTEAIRKGSVLRENNKHMECYALFEQACQSASSLLPVDSDHRGRLQLSIARAESMSPDRACAILRYAMDDVLRSGLRAVKTVLPDPSKRADVVLSRPKGHSSMGGVGVTGHQSGVVQSADEALASLIEEMKEILGAPVYNDTPLQSVARRFWAALTEAQKSQQKNEERLEQNLGKLKGEFLLARAEWEEKLTQSNELAESYKEKYDRLKGGRGDNYMEQARTYANRMNDGKPGEEDATPMATPGRAGSVRSGASGTKTGSVASLGSGLAQHAKTLVNTMNNFNCVALNERSGSVAEIGGGGGSAVVSPPNDKSGLHQQHQHHRTPPAENGGREMNSAVAGRHHGMGGGGPPSSQNAALTSSTSYGKSPRERSRSRQKPSKSFREYSKSPKRVDV